MMFFRRVCSMPCVVRPLHPSSADIAGKKAAATFIRRGSSLWTDSNARRHLSTMNLLGGPAAAFIAAKPPEFRPLCVHSNAEATNAAYSTSVSNNGNAAEGAVACSGEDDETDGTESGRLSRNTALADALSDQEAESILQAHVAVASNTQGSCLNGTNKFKEYGNVYDKHEPTMFGDWSHMGRVTDF